MVIAGAHFMFRGRHDHTIDGKGRLSIPAEFRQWLKDNGENQLIVTNFVFEGKHCLDVYPFGEWQKLEQEILQQQKNADPDMAHFINFYLSSAMKCELDAHGRILVPPDLREFAELKRDVVLVSRLKKFQAWDKANWKDVFADSKERIANNPGLIRSL
jgi:MraZ protein